MSVFEGRLKDFWGGFLSTDLPGLTRVFHTRVNYQNTVQDNMLMQVQLFCCEFKVTIAQHC